MNRDSQPQLPYKLAGCTWCSTARTPESWHMILQNACPYISASHSLPESPKPVLYPSIFGTARCSARLMLPCCRALPLEALRGFYTPFLAARLLPTRLAGKKTLYNAGTVPWRRVATCSAADQAAANQRRVVDKSSGLRVYSICADTRLSPSPISP